MKWNVLKDMQLLYECGKIKRKPSFVNDSYIAHLIHSTKELCVLRKEVIIPEGSTFRQTYEKLYFDKFISYKTFLEDNDLIKPQTRFEHSDIEQLIEIKTQMDSGSLKLLREQILKANETVRGISFMFFKNEKYLDDKKSLVEAIEKILQVPELPSGKNRQYLYVVPCKSAKAILLCENLYFLRVPERVKNYNVELWFAGGYNINMLENVDTRNLPIYYSCDWDYDGLKIFDLVKAKVPQIELLFPTANPVSIIKSEHKSQWKKAYIPASLSDLNKDLFGFQEKQLIQQLISDNSWIVEESNDIAEMIAVKMLKLS
ncbi:Wadjet anti-phage system protein JetD domain-containing protein [Marinifilum fragile]|uniref:Wadjet anti-phage system protein JetD domain-containing protein n=1 Tax=Marinifilum fragile TaxID=570161 RepID=UPI002AABCA51|nr:hypothetical protein [Marinifilum fragile]